MNKLTVYEAPEGVPLRHDFKVRACVPGGVWQDIAVYEAKVDMHEVRLASMAYFDMRGTVNVEIEYDEAAIEEVVIRPLSAGTAYERQGNVIRLTLDRPCKLSIEINGNRFNNLHLFANKPESAAPQPDAAGVLLLKPAIHRTEDIYRLAEELAVLSPGAPRVIYFAPGMHYLEETVLRIPSDTTVYLAGGAAVVGSFVCEQVEKVRICGRGIIYLSQFSRFSAFRGVRIVFSRDIAVEGITLLDPPHYSIYIGKSERVRIDNFKSFSTRGWSDGIDMMASSDIEIRDVFLRTSDDCIAVYGSRWDYQGDTRRVSVTHSILWADVAHPLMIGTHGDHERDGDIIEDIEFRNIDILEHHEPQENYQGAMAINAGDHNTIRNVTYDNIRVEGFEQGRLVDLRVVWNKDYNPAPGRLIENVVFRNINYTGDNAQPSRIHGYDVERRVEGVTFVGLVINGKPVLDASVGNFDVNTFTKRVSFLEADQPIAGEGK
ncbi:hypothetical protein KDC22_23905 [Paenibacillus tritici]|uniref:glycosyl hydrolase family 28 protein n=1 Tax=Paenibacillus tritici TaxID=1873425 RepID=UPI001BA8B90B|nr:glycosyl hydrolase family 28 protein [Paenibacillus tritici]QUL53414.1 hypothetical protein KDC22_23905 [Paenibacillus tritici]